MYSIGYDIGSSSLKAALVETATGKSVAVVSEPKVEMEMLALENGWAEQHPDDWWKHICNATKRLLSENNIEAKEVTGIGISYQMHGLVIVDAEEIRYDNPSFGAIAVRSKSGKRLLTILAMKNVPNNC